MIRPEPARWFEILAARDDATLTLEALASTGLIELEPRAAGTSPAPPEAIQPLLAEFANLAARYQRYWPQTGYHYSSFPESPLIALQGSIGALQTWAHEAESTITRLQAIDFERVELRLWQQVMDAFDESPIDFAQMACTGPMLDKRVFVFPGGVCPELPPAVLVRPVEDGDGVLCALVVGAAEAMRSIEHQANALKIGIHDIPNWLETSAAQSASYIVARLDSLEREDTALHSALAALETHHDVRRALGDAYRVQWMMQNVRALEAGNLFCWITGWTSDPNGYQLVSALEHSGVRALLHFPASDVQIRPPLLFVNPWWARPFEIFSRALGMPARDEADPSVLLAVVVPLMFGYMFGDVGQGLVIALIGFLLRDRFAIARLLVAGGIAAALFGVLFGSVFSIHALHAVWLAPLDDPLTVLWVPLAGGAVLLLVGLLLTAFEAYWRGQLGWWLVTDAGYVVAYVAILTSAFTPKMLFVAVAGALLFCGGRAFKAGRLAAGFAAIAELAERLLQLLINTLSFARVGAFALAHAGLSSAIVALMDASQSIIAKAAVLVAGNVLILALETLVVSIQTTRLVLFEFFTRFLTAQGRIFRPLPPPPSTRTAQEI